MESYYQTCFVAWGETGSISKDWVKNPTISEESFLAVFSGFWGDLAGHGFPISTSTVWQMNGMMLTWLYRKLPEQGRLVVVASNPEASNNYSREISFIEILQTLNVSRCGRCTSLIDEYQKRVLGWSQPWSLKKRNRKPFSEDCVKNG